MNVKILGTGCPNCQRLDKLAHEAAAETGLAVSFEKVTDLPSIMAYGVMSTPALVIDEQVKVAGRVPSRSEIAAWMKAVAPTAR